MQQVTRTLTPKKCIYTGMHRDKKLYLTSRGLPNFLKSTETTWVQVTKIEATKQKPYGKGDNPLSEKATHGMGADI